MSLPWRLLPTGRQTVVWAACATLLKHYGRGNDCEQKAICFASCHVCQPFPAISQVGSGVVHTVCANTHIQTNGYEKKKKIPRPETARCVRIQCVWGLTLSDL